MKIAGRGALSFGFSQKQPGNVVPNTRRAIFAGAPMTLRDISVDENRGGFCAANEGGVSRRE
jgi:hypothetical protein